MAEAFIPPLPSPEGRCVDADSLSFANRPEAGTDLPIHIACRGRHVPGMRGIPLLKILSFLVTGSAFRARDRARKERSALSPMCLVNPDVMRRDSCCPRCCSGSNAGRSFSETRHHASIRSSVVMRAAEAEEPLRHPHSTSLSQFARYDKSRTAPERYATSPPVLHRQRTSMPRCRFAESVRPLTEVGIECGGR